MRATRLPVLIHLITCLWAVASSCWWLPISLKRAGTKPVIDLLVYISFKIVVGKGLIFSDFIPYSMTRIGLLSDTHSYLDPAVLTHFADCDEIWHAGDVGAAGVVEQLEAFRPLRVVEGNIDTANTYPAELWFELEGFTIWMIHIGGAPPRYNPTVRPRLQERTPDLFVCGHSHILRVVRDPKLTNMLYLNPGATGRTGFHLQRTCLRFTLDSGRISDMQVIELGKR